MQHRRTSNVLVRLLAVLFAFALIAAACGDDDSTASDDTSADGTTPEATATPQPTPTPAPTEAGSNLPADGDPDGVLRLPTDLTATTNTAILDMPQMSTPAVTQHLLLTDVLLQEEFDGTYTPHLALSAEVTSSTSIQVTLREGVMFTDGSELTAEVAAWNLRRNRDEGKGGAMADELRQMSFVKVDSDYVFTINFQAPVVGTFYPMLSRGETMMWSQKAVEGGVNMQETPIGAGPYVLDSLVYEDKMVLKKNPDYWNADAIRIPTVEFIHVNSAVDANAVVNALKSNAVDVAPIGLSSGNIQALQGTGMYFDTATTPSVLFWGQMCKGGEKLQVPQLADVKVRQALNYAIDREQINKVLFDGKSEGQYGFWPKGHPFHDPALDDYYAQDLDKAKALLAETEWPDGFEFSIYVAPAGSAGEQFSLLVQQDWAKIGVKVNLELSTDLINDFFINNKLPLYFFPLTRSGLDKVTRNLTGASIGNICQYENPALNEQIAKIKAVGSTSQDAKDAWYALDRVALEDAVNIFGVFGTDSIGYYEDRVGDPRYIPNFQGVRVPDVAAMYVKKG